MGERVFMGPKSSGCPVERVYVRYYSTAVQRLFRTTRYYPMDFMNSAIRLPFWCTSAEPFTEYDYTIIAYVRWGTTVRSH
jgi:hypothetical protein